jgi:hypothetical protein
MGRHPGRKTKFGKEHFKGVAESELALLETLTGAPKPTQPCQGTSQPRSSPTAKSSAKNQRQGEP